MPAATGPLYPVAGFDVSSLKGATLIIVGSRFNTPRLYPLTLQPSVSLGNVPQLAADLIVSSLGLKRVAFLGTGNTTAPFAGRGDDGLVTGGLECELARATSAQVADRPQCTAPRDSRSLCSSSVLLHLRWVP